MRKNAKGRAQVRKDWEDEWQGQIEFDWDSFLVWDSFLSADLEEETEVAYYFGEIPEDQCDLCYGMDCPLCADGD